MDAQRGEETRLPCSVQCHGPVFLIRSVSSSSKMEQQLAAAKGDVAEARLGAVPRSSQWSPRRATTPKRPLELPSSSELLWIFLHCGERGDLGQVPVPTAQTRREWVWQLVSWRLRSYSHGGGWARERRMG